MSEQQQQNKIQVSNYDRIKAMSHNQSVINSFAQVLGGKREAQAYIASALLAVSNSPSLMDCTPASIMSSALRSATLRLSCDPSLGQAYLVPYNDRHKGKIATFQIGYKGLEQLALRTNKYRFINTGRLYEGQAIEENQLTGQVKIVGQRSGDKIIGYVNYFEYFSGYSHALYMSIEEIREHAARYAPGYNNPAGKWATDFHSMAKKTVLRLNLLRHGSLTSEDAAILADEAEDKLELEGEYIDTSFEDVKITDEEIAADKQPKKTAEQLQAELGFEKNQGG